MIVVVSYVSANVYRLGGNCSSRGTEVKEFLRDQTLVEVINYFLFGNCFPKSLYLWWQKCIFMYLYGVSLEVHQFSFSEDLVNTLPLMFSILM